MKLILGLMLLEAAAVIEAGDPEEVGRRGDNASHNDRGSLKLTPNWRLKVLQELNWREVPTGFEPVIMLLPHLPFTSSKKVAIRHSKKSLFP